MLQAYLIKNNLNDVTNSNKYILYILNVQNRHKKLSQHLKYSESEKSFRTNM